MNPAPPALNIDLSLFKNSYELDSEVIAKLSGIMMNSVLSIKNPTDLYKFSHAEAESFSNSLMKHSVFSEEADSGNRLELLELKEKVKEMAKYFEFVNNERKLFREIVLTMLQKKFWAILVDERTGQFFVSKLGGLNTELMRKRIVVLEASLEEVTARLGQREKELKQLAEEKTTLTKKLEKVNGDLKRFILEEAKNKTNTLDSNNSNPSIPINSITMDPPHIVKNVAVEYGRVAPPESKGKVLARQPTNRVLSKKDSLTNTSMISNKEMSHKRNVKGRNELQILVDDHIEPDLDMVQPVYTTKGRRPESTRNKK